MIKVNLLKDAGKKQKKSSDSTILDSELRTSLEGSEDNKAIIKRVIFLVVPIVLVYGYTWFIEHGLQSNVDKINAQMMDIDTQIEGLKPQLDIVEQLKSEKNKLTDELETIRKLSRDRYTYVKVLDSLQNLIPEKAWIVKLDMKDKVVSIDGRATEDTVISSFMQNLEESAYFSNVTWVDSKEISETGGVVKAFNIRFNLENI